MAYTSIKELKPLVLKDISTSEYPKSSISLVDSEITTFISDARNTNTTYVERADIGSISISHTVENYAVIEEMLPFRIRFTHVGIEGFNPNAIPGIGLQIIGISNYIL